MPVLVTVYYQLGDPTCLLAYESSLHDSDNPLSRLPHPTAAATAGSAATVCVTAPCFYSLLALASSRFPARHDPLRWKRCRFWVINGSNSHRALQHKSQTKACKFRGSQGAPAQSCSGNEALSTGKAVHVLPAGGPMRLWRQQCAQQQKKGGSLRPWQPLHMSRVCRCGLYVCLALAAGVCVSASFSVPVSLPSLRPAAV